MELEVIGMNRIEEKYYKWIWAAIFLIIAVFSVKVLHGLYLNNSFIRNAITYLDGKANTVLGLTGASTSASVAITLIPGDVGTPIANQLASISSYSVIVLAAVHLEKYLLTIAAELGFGFLIPISMVVAAVNTALIENQAIRGLVRKVVTFSIILLLVVPASVYFSTLIENTYQNDLQMSIEETEKKAQEIRSELEGQEEKSAWEQFIDNFSVDAETVVSQFENSLNNFIEAISVMLITACAIPLVTFMVLMWLGKAIFQVDLRTPTLPELASRTRIDPYRIAGRKDRAKEIEHHGEEGS